MVKVKEIMKKHVIVASKDTTLYTISKIMVNNRIGSVVIVEGNKPIGIVTPDDIVMLIAKNKDPNKMKVAELLEMKNKPLITAKPNENILRVTKRMVKNGIKRLPVVNERQELVGIVSDKELLLISPELVEILSEKMKLKVEGTPSTDEVISGLCEDCGEYSDELKHVDGSWLCPECVERRSA